MDPELSLSEAISQIRQALVTARESVVTAVMRRNYLQDEVARVERLMAELGEKTALAERIQNPQMAADLRSERTQRESELQALRNALTRAEAEAETAKLRLPEEEARLARLVNDLKAQSARLLGARVEANSPGGVGTEADELWERASGKMAELRREASAREEVAASRTGQTGPTYRPPTPAVSPEQSAEAMLSALEQRLGLASPAAAATESKLSAQASEVRPEPAPVANPISKQTEATSSVSHTLVSSGGRVKAMDPTQRVRVAAIGTGGIFRGAHLPCYPDIPQAQMVAFCDPDKTAQELVMKRFRSVVEPKIKAANERNDTETADRLKRDLDSVQIFDDISEVIAKVKPDLVDICTQPFLHTPLAIQALDAGINVMTEKPLSRSWLESLRLQKAVERSGMFYQHNENWLFDPDYYTVKKLVDSGAIGELVMMFLTQAHGGPEGNPKFWDSDYGGGGSLLDNGIHAIGAAWYVAGLSKRPTLVRAASPYGMSIRMPERIIEGRYQNVTVDDDAHILIRFEDSSSGAWSTAHVEGSWSEQDSPDTVYIGTTGRIEMLNEEGGRYAIVIDPHGGRRKFRVSGSNWQHWPSSFYGEIQNMVECIRNGKQSIMTWQFGADCSAIVGAAYLSEKNGRRAVHIEEFKEFARELASHYPNDDKAADDALVNSLLSAVRK